MIRCRVCNAEARDDEANYCTECGSRLIESQAWEQAQAKTDGFLTDDDRQYITGLIKGECEPLSERHGLRLQASVHHAIDDFFLLTRWGGLDEQVALLPELPDEVIDGEREPTDREKVQILRPLMLFAFLYAGLGRSWFEILAACGIAFTDRIEPESDVVVTVSMPDE